MSRSSITAAALALATLLPGCAVVAAAGVGAAVSNEFAENARQAYVPADTVQTLEATHRTLDALSLDPVQRDDDARTLTAIINGAKVVATVEAYQPNETRLSIAASRMGAYQDELADDILFRVRRQLR